MYYKLKKVLLVLGYGIFWCGYFYVLFVSMVCAFSLSAETRMDAVKALLVSLVNAAGLPGVICYQRYRIGKLERRIKELEKK